jgi:CBS domain-containing membrane protein
MTNTRGHLAPADADRREPSAADVMRTDVLAVEETETAGMACELIARAGYHHLPVIRHGRCVGVVDAETLHAARLRGELTGHQMRIADLRVSAAAEISPDAPLQAVAERMLERRADALLVRDASDRVVGLITMRDIVRAVASRPRPRPASHWQEQPAMFTIAPVLPAAGGARR